MKSTLIFIMLFLNTKISFSQDSIGKIKHNNVCFEDFKNNNCKCKIQFAIEDTSKLIKIQDGFYRNSIGHLYSITSKFNESTPTKPAGLSLYINGCLNQKLDPETLIQIESSFYFKDKNGFYYLQGTSGGEVFHDMPKKADLKTFKNMAGHGDYGMDKNYIFNLNSILLKIDHKKLRLIKNSKGKIVKIVQGKKIIVP